MSESNQEIAVARVSRTGALIPLNEKNRSLLKQSGIVETKAKKNAEGKLVEVGGADRAEVIAASMNLERIADALLDNKHARQTLLTAALKMPNAEEYLTGLGLYNGEEDEQYVDVSTLHQNNAGLPEAGVTMTSVTEAPPPPGKPSENKQASKKRSTRADDSKSSEAALADL